VIPTVIPDEGEAGGANGNGQSDLPLQ
jgi:hypothetical protein